MKWSRGSALLGLVVLAACGTADPAPPPTPSVVQLPEVRVPLDRDASAVRDELARVEACELLARGVRGRVVREAKSKCSIIAADGVVFGIVLGEEFDRGQRYRARLDEVAGVKVYVDVEEPGEDSCRVAMPVSFTEAVVVSGRRGSGDVCRDVREVAAAVAPELDGLTYRPDEADQALVGACVDYPNPVECRPGEPGTVTGEGEAVLTTASSDAWAACAMAADAVRQRLGDDLKPVVTAGPRPSCSFVEPGHTVLVDVVVEPRGELPEGAARTLVGRRAVLVSSEGYRRVCAVPVQGSERGTLCLAATFLPGRGVERGARPDLSRADRVEPALADIVDRHFG